jgi:hypothetical protein
MHQANLSYGTAVSRHSKRNFGAVNCKEKTTESLSPVTSKCTTRGRIKVYHLGALVF